MKSPSDSFVICLDDVPEATREWKPESDPQAMISGMAGQKGVGFPPIRLGENVV